MEHAETHELVVSIVTPTHQRRESLRRTLRALADQDYPAGRFEVIVVADGCTDGTIALLERLECAAPFRLRWIVQAQAGPAAARNAAIAAAAGDIIAFLDDDVVPVAGWLSAHMAIHGQEERAVVIGPLSPGSRKRPAWVRWEDDSLQQQYRAMLAGVYRPTPRQFYTGNSSVARRWILQAGGFDGRLRRAEDVELAFRLQDHGLHFYYEPRADGLHHSYRTYRSWQAIPRQYGHADVYMGREQGRGALLRSIGREFHRRRQSTRRLAQLCLGRPILYQLIISILGGVARVADRLDLYAPSAAACSGVWNLAYWQGLAEALGGRAAFWRLVARPPG
jgi:glycosyltransferase involved in cell wall biosynthesis